LALYLERKNVSIFRSSSLYLISAPDGGMGPRTPPPFVRIASLVRFARCRMSQAGRGRRSPVHRLPRYCVRHLESLKRTLSPSVGSALDRLVWLCHLEVADSLVGRMSRPCSKDHFEKPVLPSAPIRPWPHTAFANPEPATSERCRDTESLIPQHFILISLADHQQIALRRVFPSARARG
jgi:hypothetical protein